VHELNIREMTQEQLAEESLIDLAYALLQEKKTAMPFLELLEEIKKLNGLSDEESKELLVQFFTELNIDGRFLLNRDNTWGLREWYKIETIEEETAPTVKTRKRRKALPDDEEEIIDEDDLIFEEDLEEFIDEDEEEVDEDDEELDFVDEEIDDLDEEIDEVDDELIEGDEEFLMDDDELEEEEE
jgi:DNA-directed RNA polymerase subunit delta